MVVGETCLKNKECKSPTSQRKFFLNAVYRKDIIGNLVWTIPQGEYFEVSDDVCSLLDQFSLKNHLTEQNILDLGFEEETVLTLAKLGIISDFNDLNFRWYNNLTKEDLINFKNPPPTTIEWYPSLKCNQTCDFCYMNFVENDEYSASENDINNLLDNIKGTGIIKLAILGGEPTLWKGLPFFLNKTRSLPYDISVSSNGLLFSNDIVKLAKHHKTFQISISIHSGSPEEHDNIVGYKGAFEKTFQNLKNYVSNGIQCSVACVYNSELEYTYENLIKLCFKNKVKSISFLYQQDEIASASANSYFNRFESFIFKAIELGKRHNVIVNAPNFFVFLSPYRKIEFNGKNSRSSWLYGSKDGKTRLEITPKGDVFPSFRVFDKYQFRMGNIYNEDLSDIWLNTKIHKIVAEREYPIECINCKFIHVCGGGNIFDNLKKFGEFISSPPNCPLYQ